jgi:hypothetical protein
VQVEPCVPAVALNEPAGQGVPTGCEKKTLSRIWKQLTGSTVSSGRALAVNDRYHQNENGCDGVPGNRVQASGDDHVSKRLYCHSESDHLYRHDLGLIGLHSHFLFKRTMPFAAA